MVLYLDGSEFAIFRSPDLLHWTEASRLNADGMWECPDLFRLPIDGADKWVFWSADGYYMLGAFDGFRFTPETPVLMAYATRLPYAAQTYANVPERVISVAWLRMKDDTRGFHSMMAIPAELSCAARPTVSALPSSPCGNWMLCAASRSSCRAGAIQQNSRWRTRRVSCFSAASRISR